jgi:hypothetical protein
VHRNAADLVARSREYLLAARRGADTATVRNYLAGLDPERLPSLLPDDDHRLAFWINVYNAVVQDRLRTDPSRYDSRRRFFGREQVTVAGHDLSLDDIEHGVLRRSQLSFGLGYLRNPFPGEFERANRVDEREFRIHFALNCGAASCPPIAAYSAADIRTELDVATESFVHATTDYDAPRNVARVSRLFLWYRGDFGGKSGIVALLREQEVVPPGATPRLRYHDYDWSLALDNVATRR